jgi:hypothetical protein
VSSSPSSSQISRDAACARRILSTLAHRAYRQPPSTEHLSTLMAFYEEGRDEGGFERGIEVGLSNEIRSPFVWGILKPAIMLPRPMLQKLSQTEVAALLNHEIAHVRHKRVLVSRERFLTQPVTELH